MKSLNGTLTNTWMQLGPRFLPFADAASEQLPLGRLLRLSLFQIAVGMAVVLLNGTLNRVMIVELSVPAWIVSTMIALPLVFAPLRTLIGFRSDTHRSALGWRRVPYLWMGSLVQFGGLAIMPFALLVLSGDTHGPLWIGQVGAALAFLLVGAGLHTTQTAGLALASDLAPAQSRPRVVALLYVMLLIGMVGSALVFGALLADFSQIRLIQVIQGAALLTMVLNVIALWKQEPRNPQRQRTPGERRPAFRVAWKAHISRPYHKRSLLAIALGTAAFSMQDILLEPYGGEILHLSVSATTVLTALWAIGTLVGFALAARWLNRGVDPQRLAAGGVVIGIVAFCAVIFAAPLSSADLFRGGASLIGVGGGLFAVGTLVATMNTERNDNHGLALGAWGAVQATAAGLSIALSGGLRDLIGTMATQGQLGQALTDPAVGYLFVYHIEIALLFFTLVALGPLVGRHARALPSSAHRPPPSTPFGLAEFPG